MTARRLVLGAGAAALLWVGALVIRTLSGASADIATAVAKEGPFDLTIVETGSLQALKSVTYASTIQSNQAKIVAMAPEGKLVAKGDLLILFDSTPFEEQIREGDALLAQAMADSVKARQDLSLQEVQNSEEMAAATNSPA